MDLRERIIWWRCVQSPDYICRARRLLDDHQYRRLAEHILLDRWPSLTLSPARVARAAPEGMYWGARGDDIRAFALGYWTAERLNAAWEQLPGLLWSMPAPVAGVLADRLMRGDSVRYVDCVHMAPLDSPWRPWRRGVMGGALYHGLLTRHRVGIFECGTIPCDILDEMSYCDVSALEECARMLAADPSNLLPVNLSVLLLQLAVCAEGRGVDTSGWSECWDAVNRALAPLGMFLDVQALLMQTLPPRARAMLDRGVLPLSNAHITAGALLDRASVLMQIPVEPAARVMTWAKVLHRRDTTPADECACILRRHPQLEEGVPWLAERAAWLCADGIVRGDHAYAVLRMYQEQEALARRLWPSLFAGNCLPRFLGQFDRGFLDFAFAGRGSRARLYRRAEDARVGV